LNGHGKDVTTVEWNPVHKLILSGSDDENIKLWDPSRREEICNLKKHNVGVKKIRWNRDGTYFLSSGKDR
jgi:polyadenylation factor subunit 2